MNKTVQRKAILNELKFHNNHPTADKVYEELRKKLPQISLGTVYRNLEQLAQLGSIRKLAFSGHQKRFDGNLSKHYHIRCPQCDCITDIKVESLNRIDKNFRDVLDEVHCDGYYFELTSLCDECQQKIAAEQAEINRIANEKKHEVLTWN